MSEEKEKQRRVTFDDVVDALTVTIDDDGNITDEPTSPFKTNSGKLGKIIGYGSNATIQKHLEKIRDEINKKTLETGGAESEVPKAPKEWVDSLWGAAWTTAQVATLSRIDRLTVERDCLLSTVDAQSNDIDFLTINVGELENIVDGNIVIVEQLKEESLNEIDKVKAEYEQSKVASQGETDKAMFEVEQLKSSLNDAEKIINDLKKDMKHKEEIAEYTSKAVESAMQSTINNLNGRVAELTAMITSDLSTIDKSAKK